MEKYLVWVEHIHYFSAQESMSQCFCPVFFGSVDEGSGCCVFVYVNHPSASYFAVVSAASSRTASSYRAIPRITLSGILLFDLDSTAKVVEYVTCKERQQNLVFLPLAQNLVF